MTSVSGEQNSNQRWAKWGEKKTIVWGCHWHSPQSKPPASTWPAFTQLCQDTNVLQPGREWEVKNRRWVVRCGGGGGGSRQDAAEKAAFCELSSHYWRFGAAQGTFYYLSLTHFLVICFPNIYLPSWFRQYGTLQLHSCRISLFPQCLPLQCGNDRLCHGYRAGCGWWGGYQPSQLESTQLLGWLQCPKEDPDEGVMSPLFHNRGE